MRIIIIIYIIVSLLGCTSFKSNTPSDFKADEYFCIQPDWIARNKTELTNQLVQSIKEKHPKTAQWFPLVAISNVDIETEPAKWRNAPELKNQLNDLFKKTLAQIYTSNEEQPLIYLDQKIRTASTEMNSALYALMVPYGVACFSTLMMVCPVAGKQIVVTEGVFSKNGNKVLTLSSAGASRLVAISPYAEDSSEWGDEAKAKALIAALSQLTDKFVAHVEEHGI
jgi:hypothetical protein